MTPSIRWLIALSFVLSATGTPAHSQDVSLPPLTYENIPRLAAAVLAHDYEGVSKQLIDKADVNEPVRAPGERAGFTPLILASAILDVRIAELLIKYNASIKKLDEYRRSALWYAALHNNPELVIVLFKASGADEVVNVPDDDLRRAPLHIAVRGHASGVVKLLVAHGASIEQKDIFGKTPTDYCKQRPTDACQGLR